MEGKPDHGAILTTGLSPGALKKTLLEGSDKLVNIASKMLSRQHYP